MKHRKYESMTNSYHDKFLNNCVANVLDTMWIVQEKIHGANMQIATDGELVNFGSRNKMLKTDKDIEGFYSLMLIKDSLERRAIDLVEHARLVGMRFEQLVIYGELFGGLYPHEDVPKNNDVAKIQQGVYYSPYVHFCAFDILADGKYLDAFTVRTLFDAVGLYRIHHLFEGDLESCLRYPNNGPSTIYNHFGLPLIEDNIMEGVVIKPEINYYLPNGKRAIIKNKNEIFAEKKQKTNTRVFEAASPALELAINTMAQYMTETRLDAVISKHGQRLEGKVIGQTIGALVRDSLEDINEDAPGVLHGIDKHETKRLKKEAANISRDLVLVRMRAQDE